MSGLGFEQAADRLANYSPAGHALGRPRRAGETFAREIGAGKSAADALAAAGASDAVVAFFRATEPNDLPSVIDRIASALGRAEARERALRDAAVYPLALATSVAVLLVAMASFVRPRLDLAVAAAHGPAGAQTLPMMPLLMAIAVAAGFLVWMAAALYGRSPRAPFAEAKRRYQRSVILAAAAAAAACGVEISRALRAAASLVQEGTLAAAARELAEALGRDERGTIPSANELFGEVGGAVFVSATREGAGTGVLGALAGLAEAEATSMLPFDIVRAELLSLGLAGLAVGAAGVAFISCYSGVFRLT